MLAKSTIGQLSRSLATSSTAAVIAGTAPYHEAIVFLHTRFPPTSYPKVVPSKLQRTLQLHATQWRGLINFSWSPEKSVHERFASSDTAEWDSEDTEEVYNATAFSRSRGRLELREVSLQNLNEVESKLKTHALPADPPAPVNLHDPIHLYVCTHAERDCRCGTTGVQVFEALRKEVFRRHLTQQVKVASVGHVGGHKYAANVLVYPEGEWLGNLHTENVLQVLDSILARHVDSEKSPIPLCPAFWRGRMGLHKEEQLVLASNS
ncbi:unnamed protein product [Somion occarium]|uniref:Sucrase n=1 Tax=Somion occarium TaxID=3059160 RepID=A0ABP1DVA3_9APHY